MPSRTTIMINHVFLFTIIFFCYVKGDNNVKLYSNDNFLSQLDKRHSFVMFYAPWCSHCKRLAPVWEDLAKEFLSNGNTITIAKVDCTVDTELCTSQDITGYPTLKLYKIGEHEAKKFKGSRDLPTLKKFITDEIENIRESVQESNALPDVLIDLTDDTFEEHVASGHHFVKFFAPWCSHCQTLAPIWHELAEVFRDKKDVTIAKMDCTKSIKWCSVFDVMSYPSLLWLQDGKKVDSYQGTRSIENLSEYVSQMLLPSEQKTKNEGNKDNTLDVAGKSVISLNEANFQFHIENDFTFVKFFAPWCGHCKKLAPTWEELAQNFSKDGKIMIAHVDCTIEENKDLCNDQEVEGYPTLFLYHNGIKISEYSGSRILEDLMDFVKRHIMSHDEL